MSGARSTAPAVVLIDIENAIGAGAQLSTALARLDALLARVPAGARVIAACPPERIRPDVEHALAERGVRLLPAGTGKNAADKVLLAYAHQAADQGVRHFVVVSADAAFATHGKVHVLAWKGQPVSKALEKKATVHRLTRPGRAATPAGPASAPARPATAPATPRPATATPPTPSPPPPRLQPVPAFASPPVPVSGPAPLLRWGAATAAALFCGGLALGAGTALGNRLVHLALDNAIRPRP